MTRRDKLLILDRLIFLRAKYLKLELTLELDRQDPSPIRKANRKLAREIDSIRGQLHDDWFGSARRVTAELRAVNTRLQKSIRDIDRKIDTARNVVKAAGYVDRVLAIVGRLLGA